MYKYDNLKNKIKIDKIGINKTIIKPISSALWNNKLFVGDQKGNILALDEKGLVLY